MKDQIEKNKKPPHPHVSTRTSNEIMNEWVSKKLVDDRFAKETISLTMREKPSRFYIYRPNNYSIKIPLKAKFSLDKRSEKVFKIKPIKNWNKFILKNYYGFTVEVTSKSLILYMTTKLSRMVSSKDDIDKVTESIIDSFLKVVARLRKEFKIKADAKKWKWHRKEIGLKDDLVDFRKVQLFMECPLEEEPEMFGLIRRGQGGDRAEESPSQIEALA